MEFFYWSENLVELSFENYIIFLGKFLRVWSASVHELRGDRLGDRPRNYSRIRRSGSTVRRRRWDWRKRDRYRKWEIKKERKRKGSVTRSPTIRDDSTVYRRRKKWRRELQYIERGREIKRNGEKKEATKETVKKKEKEENEGLKKAVKERGRERRNNAERQQ